MDIFYLSCINMNYTHIQNQPYCVVQLCIKSIRSFWHSVLLLIWHKNSHSYGRNGLFFLSLSHLWLAILETEVMRGPRTVVLNLGCTRESAWEPSKILMPGSHTWVSCLISWNAGCTGRMWWCTKGWEPQAHLTQWFSAQTAGKDHLESYCKKTPAVPPIKTTFFRGSRIFRKIPDNFWCTARVKVNWYNLAIPYL